MPLLHKKQFIKKKLPKDLKQRDKVFFCELTQEVFLDYDEFWERLVLLNTLVWTCELTGRPNLTYKEALESEKKAKKCISNISVALKKPFLLVSTLTKRGRLSDVNEDVFNYIRDRYFVGEEVEAIVSKHWYDCKVTKVIMPTVKEINDYKQSLENSDDEEEEGKSSHPPLVNGIHSADDEICIIRDDHVDNSDPLALPETDLEDEEYPPFAAVKYEVVEIEPWDYKERKHHVVTWDQIRRPKSHFTREKCKMFVKQSMRLSIEGYWVLKESIAKDSGIKLLKYSDIFVGNPPKFPESFLKKPSLFTSMLQKKEKQLNCLNDNNNKVSQSGSERKNEQEQQQQKKRETELKKKDGSDLKKKEQEAKKKIKPVLTEKEKEDAAKLEIALKEKAKRDFQERLEKLRLERKWKKDLIKEEHRLMRNYEMEWFQRREDLECENHKNLPCPEPLKTRLPSDLFGEFLMILEFVNTFATTLELNDVYPNGITYEMLENALAVNEVAGVFNDVIQLLLGAIFSLQEEENEEVHADATQDNASMKFEQDLVSKCQVSAVKIANLASTWSQQYQGVPLQKAPLDALTLTEILRIHILASGATNVANAIWRLMNRGGYKNTDDPGLQFKLDEPEIIKKLANVSVFELTVEEKIKVLSVLVSQILTYASVRDIVDEKLDKLKEVSNNFRNYKWAASRKEKEELLAKKQKMRDMKLQMEKKLLEQRIQLANSGVDPSTVKSAPILETEVLEDVEEEESLEKETRSSSRKKETEGPQEKDFIEQIENLCRNVRQLPLGQDRAFRKYWLFNLVPGLFVEDKVTEVGNCCDFPTPVHPIPLPIDDVELKKVIKEQALANLKILNKEKELEKNSNGSDKENENNESSKLQNVSNISQNSLLLTPPIGNIKTTAGNDRTPVNIISNDSLPSSPAEEEEIVDLVSVPKKVPEITDDDFTKMQSKIFGLCTTDHNTCPIHSGSHSRPRWSYFRTSEELDSLIQSLNERGVRENELKQNLVQNKEKILNSFEELVEFQFDFSNKEETQSDLKRALKRNLNFAPGVPVDRIFDLTLRDIILETEEKIDNGMLGRLKVSDRNAWRQAIVDGNSSTFYNPQEMDWAGKKRIKSYVGLDTADDSLGDVEEFMSKEEITEAGLVKELTIAILLVGQSVELKYLKAPLAETERQNRKRRKLEDKLRNKYKKTKKLDAVTGEDSSSDEEEIEKIASDTSYKLNNALRTPFERWEKSLMSCSSLSQLFLHLATLDNSITWSRSATLKRRCRICRRCSDYESMLLCDECDGGFHMFCLKPKLTSVPEGDWFCDKCKPKIKPKSPRKQRHIYKEESDDDNDGSEDEGEEDSGDEEDQDEGSFVNQEFCAACEMGGELVCCDTCPKSFHLDCADLRKIPRGHWSCPLCRVEIANSSKKLKSRSSSSRKKKLKTDEEIEEALQRSTHRGSGGGIVDDEDYIPPSSDRSRRSATKRSLDSNFECGELHNDTIGKIIHCLVSHNESAPFRKPVYRQDVPDYYVKVKKPMDLRTIKVRFNKNKYLSDAEFIADVLLIFQNTQQYYEEDSGQYKAAVKLSKYFMNKVRNSDLQAGGLIETDNEPYSKRKRSL